MGGKLSFSQRLFARLRRCLTTSKHEVHLVLSPRKKGLSAKTKHDPNHQKTLIHPEHRTLKDFS